MMGIMEEMVPVLVELHHHYHDYYKHCGNLITDCPLCKSEVIVTFTSRPTILR